MTMHLLDVAQWQGSLKPADVKAAGFTAVNLKTSHGLGTKSVHPELTRWVLEARGLGLGICTFHFLTDEAPGDAQAEHAYRRLTALGLTTGTAHQLDMESTPKPALSSVRGYLSRMTALLGRPIALYTGDWWWPGNWDVHDLAPYLWAAPNAGYLPGYPGDRSAHWAAGYGGWPLLSVMQYGVKPLPGGTIDVSKSAIRDDTVWRDLTLGRPGMSYSPETLSAARRFYIDTLAKAGYRIDPASVGIVGDDSHAKAGTSYHLGEDALRSTAYSIVESKRDRSGLSNAAAALDFGWFSITVGGKAHNLRSFSVWLVAQCKAGTADTADIREVIYSADGKTVKRWDRLGIRSTGPDSHLTHTHVSYFRDSEKRSKTALITRYFTEIGVLEDEDMPTAKEVANEVVGQLMQRKIASAVDPKHVLSLEQWIAWEDGRRNSILAAVAGVQATAAAALKKVTDDDAEYARLVAEIDRRAQAIAAALDQVPSGVLSALSGGTDDEVAAALHAVLGDRAARIAALLAG